MGQLETREFLDKHAKNPKWWTSKEIAKGVGMSNMPSVTNSLRKLRRTTYILYRCLGPRDKYFYHSAATGAIYSMTDPLEV